MVVTAHGVRRGRGAGSAINHFALSEGDVHFTRLARGDEPIQFFLDGQRHLGLPQQRPPQQRLSPADATLLERELQRLAPRMKAGGVSSA
jgi:hypothetical protein